MTTILERESRDAGPTARRLPIGAEPLPGGGVSFRVWAPRRRTVEVMFEGGAGSLPAPVALEREAGGYVSGVIREAGPGSLYRFRLDGEGPYPDPASRFQPDGPHGPSRVIDPASFSWTDGDWAGVGPRGQVSYELHVGTFTREGTWAAAAAELAELADLGVTVIEMMPIADFPGRFGWGYDGVDLFAPTRLYGEPDDLRRFVDQAHRVGIGVILDVVYNHLGPDGNYLAQFSPAYFSDRHETDWGKAINFDGPESGPVREFYRANARYWIEEYHLDGLRLDATQDVHDDSADPILAALAREVRRAAGGRATYLVAENEPQHTRLVRPVESGGYGLDALWNDDFHHTAVVALTGRSEAYYSDYCGSPQELISAAKYGCLYQGQRYAWQERRRGSPSWGLPATAFLCFLENHDQVANSIRGARLHTLANPGSYRAMTALLLLGPATPLLLQGQEFGASTPFVYFADHEPDLARRVRDGRREFLAQFPSLVGQAAQAEVPDPGAPSSFERCKLDFAERQSHAAAYDLHRDLLRLRRSDPTLRDLGQPDLRVDGAVLGPEALVLRFFRAGGTPEDRLLLVNLGNDLRRVPAPEPLLAPPEGCRWNRLWSSEDPRYGGSGAPEPESEEEGWRIPGRAAVFLAPVAVGDAPTL
ncbi:MAG TPA: malto-oligosyltrehalose trehalohydrolase [Thermoanaerobaculia bacterium]|nr:malto-oligosyltrehalose trehalohydrolase [Thermoanaerobaculia bacterium]